MKTKLIHRVTRGLVLAALLTPGALHAQRYATHPAGDDSSSSLGQFRVVVDGNLVDTLDAVLAGSIFTTTEGLPGVWIYDGGVFTSPVLFDPATVVGRTDGFQSESAPDLSGAIAGRAPGRTYVSDAQLVVKPSWGDATGGVYEVHTFMKSLHLTDSMTTRMGFSVRAGMQSPTRPVSPGEVQAYSTNADFPARSFFNIYAEVDIPAGGPLPAIQLVNVDPMLVENPTIYSFPPRAFYVHGNTNSVSVYLNQNLTLTNGGSTMTLPRGTLFGQLTLAGHGMSYASYEIASFETEMETESQTPMPLNANPFNSVLVGDFSPNYNAVLQPSLTPVGLTNGAFQFKVTSATPGTTNYVQATTNLTAPDWLTLSTNVPATNFFNVTDFGAGTNQQRLYRVLQRP